MKNFLKENKIILAIILASFILGGFYYASQISKQKSIEKQQQREIYSKQAEFEAKEKADNTRVMVDGAVRERCMDEAKETAINSYKQICSTRPPSLKNITPCEEGMYYIDTYKNLLDICLQSKGLK